MNIQQIREITDFYTGEKLVFHYFKDRYALQLLQYFTGTEGKSIQQVKQSPYKGLLQKPLLKKLTSGLANNKLNADILNNTWCTQPLTYRLTFGKWGQNNRNWHKSWTHYQTSRAGKNLVLQLNFCGGDVLKYLQLIKPHSHYGPFQYGSCHPISWRRGMHTLAWVRLDIDLKTGEALIEEVQTDWVRLVKDEITYVNNEATKKEFNPNARLFYRANGTIKDFNYYVAQVMQPHLKLWDEAALAAAIWFLKTELGINRIFYHHFETGNKIKGIRWSKPPRSMYTKLPKRFCFRETDTYPSFLEKAVHLRLRREKRKGKMKFFLLEF